MANRLKMATVEAILALAARGWSQRRIARELGVNRETVGRYVAQAWRRAAGADGTFAGSGGGEGSACTPLGEGSAFAPPGVAATPRASAGWLDPKPAKAPIGSTEAYGGSGGPKPAKAPIGSAGAASDPAGGGRPTGPSHGGFIALRPPAEGGRLRGAAAEDRATLGSDPSAAAVPTGTGGAWEGAACLSVPAPASRSRCEPFRPIILAKLEQGLSAQRIWQDLVSEHGYDGRYWSVRRFVAKVGGTTALPFRRMECGPGEEAQVDFGAGAPVIDADGHRRRTRVLRVVLSHSRKAYSEAAFREGTDEFLGCLEDAFWALGGVPRTVLIDNPKTMVRHPDWYDPELNPKVQSFARHYGCVIVPTRVRTPRHKGKVERGVGYVQDNGLKGRTFPSLAAQNRHLAHWEATVADTRIHGTTRRQVGKVFREVERAALGPLPVGRFPRFQEARRTVHRDGHVEVAKAYYSVPPEYLGRQVWVRWDGHLVRVFNHRFEPIAVHVQHEAGRFSTQGEHLDSRKISSVERGATWLLEKVALIGPQAQGWAEAMLRERGIEGVRVLAGLMHLAGKHSSQAIDQACGVARTHRAFRLRTIRTLLARDGGRPHQLAFLQEHPIIRDLADYGAWVRAALRREPAPAASNGE